MIVTGPVYEEKFKFGSTEVFVALTSVGAMLGLMLIPNSQHVILAICLLWMLLAATHIIYKLIVVADGLVAVRVNQRGIELRHFYPGLGKIAVSDRVSPEIRLASWGTFDGIDLVRRPGSVDVRGRTTLSLWKYMCGKEEKNSVSSTTVAGWTLDQDKFLAVVRYYAPDIKFSEHI